MSSLGNYFRLDLKLVALSEFTIPYVERKRVVNLYFTPIFQAFLRRYKAPIEQLTHEIKLSQVEEKEENCVKDTHRHICSDIQSPLSSHHMLSSSVTLH